MAKEDSKKPENPEPPKSEPPPDPKTVIMKFQEVKPKPSTKEGKPVRRESVRKDRDNR